MAPNKQKYWLSETFLKIMLLLPLITESSPKLICIFFCWNLAQLHICCFWLLEKKQQTPSLLPSPLSLAATSVSQREEI